MEKPILFSTLMVQKILSGEKTQTRRIIKAAFHPDTKSFDLIVKPDDKLIAIPCDSAGRWLGDRPKCPYGKVGDKLWVRETWLKTEDLPYSLRQYFSNYAYKEAIAEKDWYRIAFRPSIFMPRI